MSEIEPAETKPESQSGCVDDRSFLERLWCKIEPFGSAYPFWIAVLLITIILLFAFTLRAGYFF